LHCPDTHRVLPGHSQLALQPAVQTWLTQIIPEPSLPGLQSPSDLQATPPPLLEPELEPLLDPLLDPEPDPLLDPELDPLLDPELEPLLDPEPPSVIFT
jgi:hypothetical protein